MGHLFLSPASSVSDRTDSRCLIATPCATRKGVRLCLKDSDSMRQALAFMFAVSVCKAEWHQVRLGDTILIAEVEKARLTG